MAGGIIPKRIESGGYEYWRVRLRRPKQGITINERFRSRQEAEEYIRGTVLPLLSKGAVPVQGNPARMTFAQLADLYLAQPMRDMTGERELKPSSQAERKLRIKVLKGVFGTIKINRLTPQVLSQRIEAQEWRRQNRQKYEVTLNRIFEWGRAQKPPLVAANPLNGIVRTSGKSKKLKRVYTADEWTTLLAQADEETMPLGLFLRLLKATGARKGELMRLLWNDVQPTNRDDLAARLLFRDTKNSEDRAAFINLEMYRLLQAHEQETRQPDQPNVFAFFPEIGGKGSADGVDGQKLAIRIRLI